MNIEEKETHILLVADNTERLSLIYKTFNFHNLKFHTTTNADDTITIFNNNNLIDFIIIDNESKNYNGVELLKNIKKLDPKIGIIFLSETITEQLKKQVLCYSLVNILSLNDSQDIIKNVALSFFNSLTNAKINIEVSKFLKYEKRIYKIPNSFLFVPAISDHLTRDLVQVNLVSKEDLSNIKFGIQEMIINAIEHGNLEISFEEKTKLLNSGEDINEIIERYAKKKEYKKRKVIIKYILTDKYAKYTIEDMGKGFDWRKLPDLTDKENLTLEHGRGIIMSKMFFDEFYYNEKGNKITLIIRKK